MDAYKGQAHYPLSTVGGLIDPAFVHGAAMDSNGERPTERTPFPSPFHLRWAGALRTIAVVFRRR